MKTINLKKMMPVAVFVLAISGAFLTTSMQSDTKALDQIDGFVTLPNAPKPCSIEVECSDEEGPLCRRFGTFGPQAFGKDSPTSCPVEVYRPD